MCRVTGVPSNSFAKSTLESPNALQIDILLAIGRSSDLSLARSDFNIQRIMVRICERSPLNVVRICELLSVDPTSVRCCRDLQVS